eukprot:6199702-Pleurochrysis_carterae.AAC.2
MKDSQRCMRGDGRLRKFVSISRSQTSLRPVAHSHTHTQPALAHTHAAGARTHPHTAVREHMKSHKLLNNNTCCLPQNTGLLVSTRTVKYTRQQRKHRFKP